MRSLHREICCPLKTSVGQFVRFIEDRFAADRDMHLAATRRVHLMPEIAERFVGIKLSFVMHPRLVGYRVGAGDLPARSADQGLTLEGCGLGATLAS